MTDMTQMTDIAGDDMAGMAEMTDIPDREPGAARWPVHFPGPFAPPGPWVEEALCREVDPDLFFPEKGESTRFAKSICGRCTVRAECLDYALAGNDRHGVWAGLSERELRRLRKTA